MSKTIAAIATAPGVGSIAVIRVSGTDAIKISDSIYKGKSRLTAAPSHTVHYGHIVGKSGEIIDEVLVTVMRAPRTFTREDVVEISTHGGTIASRRVLDALIHAGAYMAEPGEFTKRAFLNGRIDLSQAEAVIDIINAGNDMARRNAVSQLGGALSARIKGIRADLVHLAAQMQVIIDYPDEDLADVGTDDILTVVADCERRAQALLKSADSGRIIKSGIRTAIAGKPNVGKSSLLNSLAREERAIVTDIAGTTRDTIEESVSIDGIPLILTDTAGIRETEDAVERIGVERSRQSIAAADLVIAVLDATGMPDDDDIAVLRETASKTRIILINKTDLGSPKFAAFIRAKAGKSAVIEVSAKTGEGLDLLSAEIKRLYSLSSLSDSNGAIITNMRHKSALINAHAALSRAKEALELGMPSDIASIDINEAIDALGEITGETVSDAVVAEIFHNFCVGK